MAPMDGGVGVTIIEAGRTLPRRCVAASSGFRLCLGHLPANLRLDFWGPADPSARVIDSPRRRFNDGRL